MGQTNSSEAWIVYAVRTATVEVDGKLFTGRVYHVRENGWPCIETHTGHLASGPEVEA